MTKALPVTGLQTSLRVAARIVDDELPLIGPVHPEDAFAASTLVTDRLALRREAFRAILRELLDNDWEIDPDAELRARHDPAESGDARQ